MRVIIPLVAVVVLILLGYVGGQAPGLHFLFGVVVPYIAAAVFIVGFHGPRRQVGQVPRAV